MGAKACNGQMYCGVERSTGGGGGGGEYRNIGYTIVAKVLLWNKGFQ
jgi:hypothetical protein